MIKRITLLFGFALSVGCVEDAAKDTGTNAGSDAGPRAGSGGGGGSNSGVDASAGQGSDAGTDAAPSDTDAGPGTEPDSGAVDAGPDVEPTLSSLLPWKVGNTWTYKVTDKGIVSDKKTTIEAEEVIGGTGPHKDDKAYKVVTLKADMTDQTVSWQAVLGDLVVRYREQSFDMAGGTVELEEHWDPYKLHIDGTAEHTVAGAVWTQGYKETKIPAVGVATTVDSSDKWAVDQLDATVEVPAGRFEHAVVFTKAGGGDVKTYWYVRGVGKVKETGGQTEELESYQVTQ